MARQTRANRAVTRCRTFVKPLGVQTAVFERGCAHGLVNYATECSGYFVKCSTSSVEESMGVVTVATCEGDVGPGAFEVIELLRCRLRVKKTRPLWRANSAKLAAEASVDLFQRRG